MMDGSILCPTFNFIALVATFGFQHYGSGVKEEGLVWIPELGTGSHGRLLGAYGDVLAFCVVGVTFAQAVFTTHGDCAGAPRQER